ncbi:MAG TPA: hypothetical protein VGN18_16850 [Jatrophihabitans sp.]|jgi:EAL and modified HD-GYP domain-containing signal transduction protein|uniref:EAL and HDOD domain-containing protein n=1 Tax=Jatrophihabitans sp. TaxID=1932789 RepID=UPI002DF75C03|nr:hypothetical protein [Jatrophihabitans sp.]
MQTASASRVVIGRQGVYDAAGSLVAYELLFRGAASNPARPVDGLQMTAEVVYGALTLGLDHVSRGRTLYVNADREVLLGGLLFALPVERTVVEILETVELDDDVFAAIEGLAAAGYTLAADDFVWHADAPRLLDLVSIVKVDVLQTRPEALPAMVERCRPHDVTLLAEKVESIRDVAGLVEMGFELFQGYALEMPQLVVGATIDASVLGRLRAAVDLFAPDVDLEGIEEVVRHHPGLAVEVMRLASFGRRGALRRPVGSLHDALVLAGTRQARSWLAVLLARPSAAIDDHRFTTTLIRARACETLAADLCPTLAPLGFAAGMLSAVDLLLGVCAEEVRAALPLTDDLDRAAFGFDGPVGTLVADAIEFQFGRHDAPRLSQVTQDRLDAAFAEAYRWVASSVGAMYSTPVPA